MLATSSTPGNQLQDIFVSVLEHELRNPLSAMLAAVEVAQVAPGTAAAHKASEVVHRQLDAMSHLIEDLVDAKRLTAGKVTLRTTWLDLRVVMRDAAADVRDVADAGGQALCVAEEVDPLWIDGDRRRLHQVLVNLLGNAMKSTQEGDRITMAAKRLGSTAILRVRDTGRGIDPDALPHVFDLFSQIPPFEATSLGVGLSIVREIVLLHGGSIEARSQGAWRGSEFVVTLPLAELSE